MQACIGVPPWIWGHKISSLDAYQIQVLPLSLYLVSLSLLIRVRLIK
jgi:hypothetical protein